MDDAGSLLKTLISIPSVNPMGRPYSGPEFLEARLTDFLEGWLRDLPVEITRQTVSPGRDNLIAEYRAPDAKSHWLFEVHQDTVPVVGMTVPPFEPTTKGDLIFGRGACDNKGPMTSMLLAFAQIVRERGPASVTLLLTVDEEFTFTGISKFAAAGHKFAGAIVAEPTDLDVVIAHKGGARWEVVTPGVMCHSSAPERGVNAIYRMGKVLGSLERYAASLADRPADRLLGKPTLSVGVISGGVAVNIVPDSCVIQVDRRLIPGETPSATHADCQAWIGNDPTIDFDVEFKPPWLNLPPMSADINAPLTESLLAAIKASKPNAATKAEPYGSDAAILHAAGIPTVIFGPGSITKAHTVDECVPLSEVEAAVEVLARFCLGA